MEDSLFKRLRVNALKTLLINTGDSYSLDSGGSYSLNDFFKVVDTWNYDHHYHDCATFQNNTLFYVIYESANFFYVTYMLSPLT